MVEMVEGTGEEQEEVAGEVVGFTSKARTRALYLHIGLTNGVLLSTVVDDQSGELRDSRTR
jgi:hypothetical protein